MWNPKQTVPCLIHNSTRYISLYLRNNEEDTVVYLKTSVSHFCYDEGLKVIEKGHTSIINEGYYYYKDLFTHKDIQTYGLFFIFIFLIYGSPWYVISGIFLMFKGSM